MSAHPSGSGRTGPLQGVIVIKSLADSRCNHQDEEKQHHGTHRACHSIEFSYFGHKQRPQFKHYIHTQNRSLKEKALLPEHDREDDPSLVFFKHSRVLAILLEHHFCTKRNDYSRVGCAIGFEGVSRTQKIVSCKECPHTCSI